jgi:pimeloyl-ACP methyl ester carboxylesterase
MGAAGLGLAAAGGVFAQRHHMRRVASDPNGDALQKPPQGTPLSARAPDGTQLHAEVFGPEDGETIVLLHGWTEMLAYWIYVIEDLVGRGLRVVAVDLRGHGQSEPAAEGEYALSRFAEDLEAMLEVAVPEGRRAIVAGHSLGAMTIAAWAEHHDVPRLVRGAALINTGVGDLIAEQLLVPVPPIARALSQTIAVHGFLGSATPLPRFSTPLSYALLRYTAFGPTATPAQIAFFERMLWTCPPRVRADVGIAMSEMDLFDALAGLTVPTVVIGGERDRLTPPSHARRIAEMLPDCRELIILPETGHMGPLERPHEIGDALQGLATSTPDRTGTLTT